MWYMPAKNRVEPGPVGVVGVVSPWNFPLHLALIPAATALAAGNRVMLKVSEYTPRTSAVLKRLIEENFSPDTFYVTDGPSGTKVTDPTRVEDLQRAILAGVSHSEETGDQREFTRP